MDELSAPLTASRAITGHGQISAGDAFLLISVPGKGTHRC
jgi:hypothetical protein